jgi:MoaA/NifB/PqqE/SkfB family radical SAM enzyme
MFENISVFLNRDCPRNCLQCGIADHTKKPMSPTEWIEAFSIMKEAFQAKFFLFLGTEPLLFRDGILDMIRWLGREELFYGFYSTSPEPLFSQYREKLLEAGLNNWACGIDVIPGMFKSDPITEAKAKDGLRGLLWMAERGVQTMIINTVSDVNLDYIPDIIEYCQEHIPGCLNCLNPVEWRHDDRYDFFSKKEHMKNLVIPPEREPNVIRMVERVLQLTRRPGYQIQNLDRFLLEYKDHYSKLDYRCGGRIGPGVDCDGSMRLCGYCKGSRCPTWNVKDLRTPEKVEAFLRDWDLDVKDCIGCFWSYIYTLEDGYFEALTPRSKFYQERHKTPIPIVPR